jgi:hypothetical protein
MAVSAAPNGKKRIIRHNKTILVSKTEKDLINASIAINTIALHETCEEIKLKAVNRIAIITPVINMLSAGYGNKPFKVVDFERYLKRVNCGQLYEFIKSLGDHGFITISKVENKRSRLTGWSYEYKFTNKAIEMWAVFTRVVLSLMAEDSRLQDRVS